MKKESRVYILSAILNFPSIIDLTHIHANLYLIRTTIMRNPVFPGECYE